MAEVTSHPPGAFCWIELGTSDQKAAKDFYTQLFGWSFADNDMGPGMIYTVFTLKGRDAAACYALDAAKMPGVPPHWMLYVATADADASARRTAELGGKVMAPAFDVMDLGRMAVLADPQGAHISVWQAKANKGIGIHNEPGAFCWGQLNTSDTAKRRDVLQGPFRLGREDRLGRGHDVHRVAARPDADRRDDVDAERSSRAAALAPVLRRGGLRRRGREGRLPRRGDARASVGHPRNGPLRRLRGSPGGGVCDLP